MKAKKNKVGVLDAVFWIAVVVTVMLSWSAVDGYSQDALTLAFAAGAIGLIAYVSMEEES